MIIILHDKTIQEIIQKSNHETVESVLSAYEYGVLDIYQSKKEYLSDGWPDNEDYHSVLSDGRVVSFA